MLNEVDLPWLTESTLTNHQFRVFRESDDLFDLIRLDIGRPATLRGSQWQPDR